MRRALQRLGLLGFTIGYAVLLERNFRAIYSQTVFYTWCQRSEPWPGWLHIATLSAGLLVLSGAHVLLELSTDRILGTLSLILITAVSLWVGLWAYVTVVLSSEAAIVLSSPTAIPFLQGMGTALILRAATSRRRRARIVALSGVNLGMPALWLAVNFLVATGACDGLGTSS